MLREEEKAPVKKAGWLGHVGSPCLQFQDGIGHFWVLWIDNKWFFSISESSMMHLLGEA